MLQACSQGVDLKVDRHFGEGQAASLCLPVTLALVTKSKLAFFRELAKPFDPNLRPTPPTAEEIQELFAIAAKYGYWLTSPEENAAIGLSMV
jgi:hypothetical protein